MVETELEISTLFTKYREPFAWWGVYTPKGDPAAWLGIESRVWSTDTASELSFATARTWISDCLHNHEICRKPIVSQTDENSNFWPCRLIDVEAFGENSLDVCLIGTSGPETPYVTLSYCWGPNSENSHRTLTKSLNSQKSKIVFQTLPITIQDAIRITRNLGFQYLWVDAICIIQDSDSDWQTESKKMAHIYSRSIVTIAASSSFDSSGGCFNQHSTGGCIELQSQLSTEVESRILIDTEDWDNHPLRQIMHDPLSRRGWVCQERLVSPRTLHYTSTGLLWECRMARGNEHLGVRLNSEYNTLPGLLIQSLTQFPLSGARSDYAFAWYTKIIAIDYSRRVLSRSSDKLPAVSGLARLFHQYIQWDYIAGIWLEGLSFGLCWRRKGLASKPADYRCPSFSWAAL
ncbi:HET-domain-containing protein, partial [Stipitochalara longipes BDJ]